MKFKKLQWMNLNGFSHCIVTPTIRVLMQECGGHCRSQWYCIGLICYACTDYIVQ